MVAERAELSHDLRRDMPLAGLALVEHRPERLAVPLPSIRAHPVSRSDRDECRRARKVQWTDFGSILIRRPVVGDWLWVVVISFPLCGYRWSSWVTARSYRLNIAVVVGHSPRMIAAPVFSMN